MQTNSLYNDLQKDMFFSVNVTKHETFLHDFTIRNKEENKTIDVKIEIDQ